VTPIYVHNLHDLGIGFFLVITVVVIIGFVGCKRPRVWLSAIPDL